MAKDKSEKKEKKDKKKSRHSEDGVKKEKKEKRKSSDATAAAASAIEGADVSAVAVVDADGDVEVGDASIITNGDGQAVIKAPLAALVPFANPLCDEKNGKKVLKTVKKGSVTRDTLPRKKLYANDSQLRSKSASSEASKKSSKQCAKRPPQTQPHLPSHQVLLSWQQTFRRSTSSRTSPFSARTTTSPTSFFLAGQNSERLVALRGRLAWSW